MLRKLLKDVYAYGLIPRDIRDSLIDVETKVPDIKNTYQGRIKIAAPGGI